MSNAKGAQGFEHSSHSHFKLHSSGTRHYHSRGMSSPADSERSKEGAGEEARRLSEASDGAASGRSREIMAISEVLHSLIL